jgi:DNA topoisomerase-1
MKAKVAAKKPLVKKPVARKSLARKSLVVVESPTKVKTIQKYLDSGYIVKASMGHVRDLPKSKLGVDEKKGFKPDYKVLPAKKKVLDELKKAAEKVDALYIATDPDREGEAIGWHLAAELGISKSKTYRIMFNEITERAVKAAFQHPGKIDTNKVDAQQARRVLDRLVGYMVSPLLQKIIVRGVSAGRVQSVALRLICEREDEIRAFKTEEYWTIEADLLTKSDEKFLARLVKIKDEKAELSDEKSAKKAVAAITKETFKLTDLKTKPSKSSPNAPYTTSTLQQDAARRLGFLNQRTMGTAQGLYEGIEVGSEGPVGLITYMRTDSVRLAPEAVAAARGYIAERFGEDYLPDHAREYKTKSKAAQEAHEAIRPTDVTRDPKSIKKYLKEDQYKLYELIYNRFLASQMADARFEVTTAQLMAGEYEFRANGRRMLFPGYLVVMTEMAEEKRKSKPGEEEEDLTHELPKLEVGKSYKTEKITPTQHFTQPPPRFNDGSLVKVLDELGIGRPSTYASIITVLVNRKYVERKEKRFHPTNLGETVSKVLVEQFPDIFNVSFTARMEEELDSIENDGEDWRKVVKDFYGPFSKDLEKVNLIRGSLKKANEEISDKKCPECGKHLIVKWGRSGQFFGCSGYPDCKYTAPLEAEKTPEFPETACPKCGKPMLPKRSRFGWFLGCSGYPECKTIVNLVKGDSVDCPSEGCDGKVSEKKSRKGRSFWGCSNYPKCDFVSWYKPVLTPCPACGHFYMEDKHLKTGHIHQCPKCKHKIEIESAEK